MSVLDMNRFFCCSLNNKYNNYLYSIYLHDIRYYKSIRDDLRYTGCV